MTAFGLVDDDRDKTVSDKNDDNNQELNNISIKDDDLKTDSNLNTLNS